MIDHVSLAVADLAAARRFYDAATAPLGIPCVGASERWVGYGLRSEAAHPERSYFSLFRGEPAIDGRHVCLKAPSRAAVDAFWRAGLAAGGRDDGPPGLRPHYHASYYAAFLIDPSGNRIEAVCHAAEPGPAQESPAIADGAYRVPAGKLVEVVTHLEMPARPALPAGAGGLLDRVERPDLAWYRALFRRIGEPWLWFSRLTLDDAGLAAILHDPRVETWVLREGRDEIGLVELDRRVAGEAEIVFFGLAPEAVGQGRGRAMMEAALDRAWRPDTRRVWLHTCQFDHPAALGFYRKAGFVPFATTLEVGDDPRLTGVLARDAAPHVPLAG